MEKVFSPADEEGHSVSSSSPSTRRLIAASHSVLRRAPVFSIQLACAASYVFRSAHAIRDLARDDTGTAHMLLACRTHAGHEGVVSRGRATGVGFQPRSVFIDQTLSVARRTLMMEAAEEEKKKESRDVVLTLR